MNTDTVNDDQVDIDEQTQIDGQQDNEQTNNDDKPDNNRLNKTFLSGAGKKRLRWYLLQGYPLEIARAVALLPMASRNSSKLFHPTTPMVFILPETYPDIKFDIQQTKLIETSIIEELKQIDGPKIKFTSYSHEHGFLKIVCADEYSKKWLMDMIDLLTPWTGEPKLKGLTQEKNLYYVWVKQTANKDLTFHPFCVELTNENDGLDTSQWKCIRCDGDKINEIKYTIAIDDDSMKYLEANKFNLIFNTSTIEFRSLINNSVQRIGPKHFRNKRRNARDNELQQQRNVSQQINPDIINQLIVENLKQLFAESNYQQNSSINQSSRNIQRRRQFISNTAERHRNYNRRYNNFDDNQYGNNDRFSRNNFNDDWRMGFNNDFQSYNNFNDSFGRDFGGSRSGNYRNRRF